MDFIDEKIEKYAFDHTSYEGDLLKQLEEETYEKQIEIESTGDLSEEPTGLFTLGIDVGNCGYRYHCNPDYLSHRSQH